MRPDEHKKKDSRRYQARKKNQGDATAAEVAERRRIAAAKARDTGTSVAAIRRRNGELPSLQQVRESAEATAKIKSSRFTRRKIVSNQDRYTEISEQDAMLQDAELGIDRETTDLVAMLEEKQQDETEAGSTYFKFKGEDIDTSLLEKQDQSMFQVNFDLYEELLGQVNCLHILGLDESDAALVDAAFGEQPMMPSKPIVPAFSKTAQGLVLFNQKPKVDNNKSPESPVDGIYLRNERKQHHPNTISSSSSVPMTTTTTTKQNQDNDDKDLDELLSMESSTTKDTPVRAVPIPTSSPPVPTTTSIPSKIKTPAAASSPSIPKPRTLPRPSSSGMKKQEQQKSTNKDDDEAWLDDILG
ncbi:hypothetical protein BDA99DRAFT_559482 [Phascolomyces articulosus]|uniref:Uncharacterized protein n=1 Tax=Phascolomyces articulosus TaxID=60185 RepID=A0AAD5PE81_9FUNG|nr:hypothetical protein BDA99DRAFT_559482 [Phascolomyces articulosus]